MKKKIVPHNFFISYILTSVALLTISFSHGAYQASPQTYPIAELPQENTTHYIVCSNLSSNTQLAQLVQDGKLAQSLNTSEWATITMINSYNQEDILNATQQAGNPVIIAFGPYAPYVAQATQLLGAHKSHKKIHSILFFNPIVTKDRLGTPIDICYDAVDYRVYNFFAKTSEIYNYKIIPCNPEKPLYLHRGKLYIKGVNICCYEIDQAGVAQNFPVLLPSSWLSFTPYLPESFITAWPNIVASINKINNNYQINTNLSCVLKSSFQGRSYATVPHEILLPLVTIYRHTDITNEHCLHSIITEKGTASSLVKTLSGSVFSSGEAALAFKTCPIEAQARQSIRAQLSNECLYNARVLRDVPYFQQFCLKGLPLPAFKAIQENQHLDEIAQVRDDASLCHQEEAYVCKRKLLHVKPTVEHVLGGTIPNNKIPTIAIVASGGGVRAMMTILGVLKGLELLGLLNAVTYISTLSGSTWAVGSWLSSGKSLSEICDDLTSRIPALTKPNMIATAARCMKSDIPSSVRQYFSQNHTLVDYYGSILLQGLLGFDPFNPDIQPTYLSRQLDNHTACADVPFPIYTTISFDSDSHHSWYECTPHEFGKTFGDNVHYIPIWALGRHFNGGYSQDFAPEISFGTLLGTFGSAFGISCKEYLQFQKCTATAQMCPDFLKDLRFSYQQFANPTRNMNNPMCDESILKCTDAGIACNLPYPPVSGLREARKADIVIFVDAGDELEAKSQSQFSYGETIQKVQQLFVIPHKGKIAFPEVPQVISCHHGPNNQCQTTVSIDTIPFTSFQDKANNGAPTVIYMPLVKSSALLTNPDLQGCLKQACKENHWADPRNVNMYDFATLNLAPTTEQARSLIALMEFNVLAHNQCLRNLISDWINNPRKQTTMEPYITLSGIHTLRKPAPQH